MGEFNLRSGQSVLVDDHDLERVLGHPWVVGGGTRGYGYYVICRINGHTVYLHRFLTDPPPGFVVDHINGDHFDNRRANLRVVTHQVNLRNRRGATAVSTTGVRNVTWSQRDAKYRVRMRGSAGHNISGGYFADLESAAHAAQALREKVYG